MTFLACIPHPFDFALIVDDSGFNFDFFTLAKWTNSHDVLPSASLLSVAHFGLYLLINPLGTCSTLLRDFDRNISISLLSFSRRDSFSVKCPVLLSSSLCISPVGICTRSISLPSQSLGVANVDCLPCANNNRRSRRLLYRKPHKHSFPSSLVVLIPNPSS